MAVETCHEVTFGYGWFRPRKRRIYPSLYFTQDFVFVSARFVLQSACLSSCSNLVGCNGFSCLQKVEFHVCVLNYSVPVLNLSQVARVLQARVVPVPASALRSVRSLLPFLDQSLPYELTRSALDQLLDQLLALIPMDSSARHPPPAHFTVRPKEAFCSALTSSSARLTTRPPWTCDFAHFSELLSSAVLTTAKLRGLLSLPISLAAGTTFLGVCGFFHPSFVSTVPQLPYECVCMVISWMQQVPRSSESSRRQPQVCRKPRVIPEGLRVPCVGTTRRSSRASYAPSLSGGRRAVHGLRI